MAAYKDGKCILNLASIEQIGKEDEKRANKEMNKLNREQDRRENELKETQLKKIRETTSTNFQHIKEQKSLFDQLQEQIRDHPEKQNEIYATLRLPEILDNLSKEEIRILEKQKADRYKVNLDHALQVNQAEVKGQTFMGMSDAEILNNKETFL